MRLGRRYFSRTSQRSAKVPSFVARFLSTLFKISVFAEQRSKGCCRLRVEDVLCEQQVAAQRRQFASFLHKKKSLRLPKMAGTKSGERVNRAITTTNRGESDFEKRLTVLRTICTTIVRVSSDLTKNASAHAIVWKKSCRWYCKEVPSYEEQYLSSKKTFLSQSIRSAFRLTLKTLSFRARRKERYISRIFILPMSQLRAGLWEEEERELLLVRMEIFLLFELRELSGAFRLVAFSACLQNCLVCPLLPPPAPCNLLFALTELNAAMEVTRVLKSCAVL